MRFPKRPAIIFAGILGVGGLIGVGNALAYTHTLLTPWGDDYQTATYYVQSDFGSLSKTQISDGMIHLNSFLSKQFLYKSSQDTTATQPAENGVKTITKNVYGLNGTIAENLPYTNWLGTYVVETDIRVNVSYKFANSAQPGTYDLQSVVTHELGHALRVNHSSNFYDTMFTPWETKQMNTIMYRDVTDNDSAALKDSTVRWLK